MLRELKWRDAAEEDASIVHKATLISQISGVKREKLSLGQILVGLTYLHANINPLVVRKQMKALAFYRDQAHKETGVKCGVYSDF